MYIGIPFCVSYHWSPYLELQTRVYLCAKPRPERGGRAAEQRRRLSDERRAERGERAHPHAHTETHVRII